VTGHSYEEPRRYFLGVEEKGEFLERLSEVDFDEAWDSEIAADAQVGRLDHLWQQALEDIKAGRTKPLDEVLNEGLLLR
jgi:hypothetical protein